MAETTRCLSVLNRVLQPKEHAMKEVYIGTNMPKESNPMRLMDGALLSVLAGFHLL